MERLRNIKADLKKIKDDLNFQLQELQKSKDITKFHNFIADIVSKYPDQKELIQFMVFINDEITRNTQLHNELITDTVDGIINKNTELISHLEDIYNKKVQKVPKTFKEKFADIFKHITFKDIKFIAITIIIILVLIIILHNPTEADKLFEHIFKMLKYI